MRTLFAFAHGFRTAALELLFPSGCASCDEPVVDGHAFCSLCSETLVPVDDPCPRCATPRGGVSVCRVCLREPMPFSEARSAYAYGGAVADALRLLKFSARTDLGVPLGRLLAPLVAECASRLEAPIVVPVPLSRRRLARRGYNQAALIALAATRHVRTELLFRVRDTPSQIGLSAAQRREALRGAFSAVPRVFAGRDVIVIDDVMTTGATLAACANALHAEGARRIVALTVARALP